VQGNFLGNQRLNFSTFACVHRSIGINKESILAGPRQTQPVAVAWYGREIANAN
jgi:hypothetical protein